MSYRNLGGTTDSLAHGFAFLKDQRMEKVANSFFPFYTFSLFRQEQGLIHFVSSGKGNIGFSGEESLETVISHRRLLGRAVGIAPEQWITAHQVHSTRVAVVGKKEQGRGALEAESRLANTDALVTCEEEVCLVVLSADCVPVLLYDPAARVIAAVHAGWRGTAAGIIGLTVRTMQEQFGCRAENILAGIGPSIGACCFEVGEEVAHTFRELYPGSAKIVNPERSNGKYKVDLWEANRLSLLETGLLPSHVAIAGLCTWCSRENFFSYRREGQKAGRFGAGIMMTGKKEN